MERSLRSHARLKTWMDGLLAHEAAGFHIYIHVYIYIYICMYMSRTNKADGFHKHISVDSSFPNRDFMASAY